MKAECQQQQGKALNEEQQTLLSSKIGVERSLIDLEALKVQLEEVAKEQIEEEIKVICCTL